MRVSSFFALLDKCNVITLAKMTFRELNDRNYFEVNAIHVEILLPDIVALAIPENKPGAIYHIKLVVQITNNTLEPFTMSFDDTFIPEVVNSDGQTLQGVFVIYEQEPTNQSNISQQQNWRLKLRCLFSRLVNFNRRKYPINVNFWLVQPGSKSASHLNGRLFWQSDLLILKLSTKDFSLDFEYFRPRTYYYFNNLQLGNYQLRFIYLNKFSSSYNESDAIDVTNLPQIASSHSTAAFVNFRLIQPVEPNNSAVKVDGIRFETLMPERVLTLPEKKRGIKTCMQLGIHITNNMLEAVRFSFFATIIPQLVGADGQVHLQGYYGNHIKIRLESDFPLVMPGENFTFFLYSLLYWQKRDQFILRIEAGDGGYCIFTDIKAGVYQIRLTYNNKDAMAEIYDRETRNTKLIEGIWMGIVSTPKVEFRLV
ncbi:hypothetical protein H6G97_16000 [Nostoc flagelliforme FACHB-838]|uniref:Uncharacterized protein n=1 Tax=Nostoc flagelliforme FACHB-838 TaxID=2692904 RepID=A0ABR8DNI0_9NOSO|nr:hypothetical protein [Nostoc flagelliforme]MBD2531001.1 hypothetical protein [Nostoc flagelliforme FACHB-838]